MEWKPKSKTVSFNSDKKSALIDPEILNFEEVKKFIKTDKKILNENEIEIIVAKDVGFVEVKRIEIETFLNDIQKRLNEYFN